LIAEHQRVPPGAVPADGIRPRRGRDRGQVRAPLGPRRCVPIRTLGV